ncbi:MAG: hypothetical protein AB7S26_11480 [Sandaracinaceae bacterium]
MPQPNLLRALLASFLLAACGGGAANEEPTDTADTTQTTGSEAADPSEGGRRLARQGEECDFGGAAEHTCQLGLSCCYGPPDDPGDHGACQPECPEY